MRLTGSGDPAAPGAMSSSGSANFLLVPIPEYPLLDCVPNKTVKIVVLGASNVGKTALIVRFLTKRFIGDYEANTGALYSRKVTLDGEEVSLQIQDTPCVALQDDAEGLYCQEQINRSIYWADGYVLVFSITDHSSYRTIQPLYQHVRRIHPSGNIPVMLIGNKSDLLRARQVPADEGETLASSLGIPGVGGRQRRETQRRPPPGSAQVSQHAGAEEEVQAGPLLQSQISHQSLMPHECQPRKRKKDPRVPLGNQSN
ncbi:ras-like protein family member 11A-like isoform X2 [Nerophis lumbriciformis]|uniref:ras-like protein family member 11A-like isoform X2 n=1 Tax=Nerophis lumbriciformis TaxID=546530 RepID=UPI002ADFF9DA|nr:ras-like protein family member 11A-like isoform X2 [Nerophis lumbriciformis]XP_061921857.1 ras-like protein family member 11A-like isoform X2 [Entelurus aequoreus]